MLACEIEDLPPAECERLTSLLLRRGEEGWGGGMVSYSGKTSLAEEVAGWMEAEEVEERIPFFQERKRGKERKERREEGSWRVCRVEWKKGETEEDIVHATEKAKEFAVWYCGRKEKGGDILLSNSEEDCRGSFVCSSREVMSLLLSREEVGTEFLLRRFLSSFRPSLLKNLKEERPVVQEGKGGKWTRVVLRKRGRLFLIVFLSPSRTSLSTSFRQGRLRVYDLSSDPLAKKQIQSSSWMNGECCSCLQSSLSSLFERRGEAEKEFEKEDGLEEEEEECEPSPRARVNMPALMRASRAASRTESFRRNASSSSSSREGEEDLESKLEKEYPGLVDSLFPTRGFHKHFDFFTIFLCVSCSPPSEGASLPSPFFSSSFFNRKTLGKMALFLPSLPTSKGNFSVSLSDDEKKEIFLTLSSSSSSFSSGEKFLVLSERFFSSFDRSSPVPVLELSYLPPPPPSQKETKHAPPPPPSSSSSGRRGKAVAMEMKRVGTHRFDK